MAAAALVTVVAGLIGFGIGFALGCWTGPGAFFSAIATSYAAASVVAASTSLGLITAGLTAYSLFKTPKEMAAINEFATKLCDGKYTDEDTMERSL